MGRRPNSAVEYAWERLDAESPEAYEAFSIYRDDDTTLRSLPRVSRKLSKSLTLIKRWSAKHDWIYRAREYDKHIDAKALREAETAIAKMRARHIKIGQMLQEKGIKVITSLDDKNKLLDDLEPADAIRMITEGVKLEAARATEELAAHKPAQQATAEEEALAKLDDILGRIKSEF